MNNNRMYLIEKLFNNKRIRTVWNDEEEKYYISVVDVVGVLTDSEYQQARNNWKVIKFRLKKEGNQSVTKCNQLKLKSSDGKYYMTDVVDIEGMFRIIESIPSKKAEPIKQWLAHIGSERIDEIFRPSIAAERAIELYRAKGYDEKWISERIQGIQDRRGLTEIWKYCGITEDKEFAILTNILYKNWSGMTAKEYKEYKGLKNGDLRDNMSRLESILTDLSEETTKELAKEHRPYGLAQNELIAELGGSTARIAREDIERKLGKTVITSDNNLNSKHIEYNN